MLETLAGWNEDIAEGVFAFEETVEPQHDCDHFSWRALRLQLA